MLAQYLALLGATNLQNSKRTSDEAANSPQADKERTSHVDLLVENLFIVFQKYF